MTNTHKTNRITRLKELEADASAGFSKFKFEALVEHCKKQDREIADMRYELNVCRLYSEGNVWFWQGDGTDNLPTIACPIVINAGDLRSLINSSSVSADKQPQSLEIPDGYAIVPIEPTPEMLDAEDHEHGGFLVEDTEYYFADRERARNFVKKIYQGVLAAAPKLTTHKKETTQ